MANKQHIKIFSHNDLDGFGAPVLLKTLQPYLFKNAMFEGKFNLDDKCKVQEYVIREI